MKKRKVTKEQFNKRFEIVEYEDGHWSVQAFTRKNKPLGRQVMIRLPSEAWRIFMILNGLCDQEPTEIIEMDEVA